MKPANHAAEVALAMLDRCCDEVEPVRPWSWQCAFQNGTRLPLSASYADGFLRLAAGPAMAPVTASALDRAIRWNAALTGGIKIAIDAARRAFALCADLVVLDEAQLLARLRWALDGFHDGLSAFATDDSLDAAIPSRPAPAPASELPELLGATPWEFAERDAGACSVALDAESAPPARVWMDADGISLSVELARASAVSAAQLRALGLFLLTVTGALRLVRAGAVESDGQTVFTLAARLPQAPAPEELDHALASLSVAYRLCARESCVLLDEAAAACYLAVRRQPMTCQSLDRKEN